MISFRNKHYLVVLISVITSVNIYSQFTSHIQTDSVRGSDFSLSSNPAGLVFNNFFDLSSKRTGFTYSHTPSNLNIEHKLFDRPVTNLSYSSGGGFQKVYISQRQNLSKFSSLQLFYNKINAEGLYVNDNADQSNFSLNTYLTDSLNSYKISYSYHSISGKIAHNGGVDTTVFKSLSAYDSNRKNVKTRLDNASRLDRTRLHVINLSKSLDSANQKSINLRIQFENEKRIFQDIGDLNETYYSKLKSVNSYNTLYDSIRVRNLETEIFLLNPIDIKDFDVYFGLMSSNFMAKQAYKDTLGVINSTELISGANQIAQMKLKSIGSNPILFESSYNLFGYNKDDFSLSLIYHIGKYHLYLFGKHIRQKPDYIFYSNSSPYFSYANTLDQQNFNHLNISYLNKGFSVNLSNYIISNYTFFDKNLSVVQLKKQSIINALEVKYSRSFNRIFIDYRVNLNNTTDSINLPLFAADLGVYYNYSLFKKSLPMTIGFVINYQNEYSADAYAPLLGTRYYQNDINIGNYPVVDFYLDIHLKSATLYLKVDHINQGLLNDKMVYTLPYYPITDRLIRFGVFWRFYN